MFYNQDKNCVFVIKSCLEHFCLKGKGRTLTLTHYPNENYIFFSLSLDNGTPVLNFQQVQKNNEFIKAFCIDASTKLYLQLENGKIITLVHTNTENCGTFFRNEDKNVRVLSANFLLMRKKSSSSL